MKHWDEMTDLEDQIVRLEYIQSLMRLICEGSENSTAQDVINSLLHITGTIEDVNEKASKAFSKLWDVVRLDSHQSEVMNPLVTRDYIKPSKESNELNAIINGWVRSEGC